MDTIRKWLYKPKEDDKSLLARFYHADRALTAVASELDSFDGRAEPERCSRLVSRLRQGQDRVLAITNQIMDELLCDDRTPRAFRAKFPEEVLQESLAGQLWFGAECLAAGSSIMNREEESAAMRPLAKAVTKSLDNVRNLLREQCLRNNIPNSPTLNLDLNDAATETLYESLKIFDCLFAEFELSYVSAMVQVKSKQEHEMQELICVLFSETLQRALKLGIIEQEQVDSFDPSLMFSIPRLAIIAGLIIYDRGPLNMELSSDQMSEMFRPFRTLLIRIRDLLLTLNKNELYQLEKLLCTNEDIHLKNSSKLNCDDVKINNNNSDDDLVSNIVNDSRCNNKGILTNFYSPNIDNDGDGNNVGDVADPDVNCDDDIPNNNNINDNCEILVQPDCATGYLISNTNFGNLLQTNEAPLTDSFISSEDEYNFSSKQIANEPNTKKSNNHNHKTNHNNNNNSCDDIEHKSNNGSSHHTKHSRTAHSNPSNKKSKTERYQENWDNLEKSQPGCSKTNSDSSDDYDTTTEKSNESSQSSTKTSSRSSSERSTTNNKSLSKSRTKSSRSSSSKRRTRAPLASDSSSSGETSSCKSSDGDPKEIALAVRAAGRMKFKSIENLLHRLFVCIAGVADQLQTNFASDLRQILRSVFLINTSPPQEEITIPEKAKESDMFEFRASENDVIQENSGGSNQSIYSAEEANPESDSVFDNNNISGGGGGGVVGVGTRGERSSSFESENRVPIIRSHHIERSRSLGETPNDREININVSSGNGGDGVGSGNNDGRQLIENKRANSVRERNRKIGQQVNNHSNNNNSNSNSTSPENSPTNNNRLNRNVDTSQQQQQQTGGRIPSARRGSNGNEKPPRWIPDEEAPRCMACAVPFTAFRRRHHCRNCGGVFCGVCSNSTAPLPKYGLNKAVRVCRDCFVREVGV